MFLPRDRRLWYPEEDRCTLANDFRRTLDCSSLHESVFPLFGRWKIEIVQRTNSLNLNRLCFKMFMYICVGILHLSSVLRLLN